MKRVGTGRTKSFMIESEGQRPEGPGVEGTTRREVDWDPQMLHAQRETSSGWRRKGGMEPLGFTHDQRRGDLQKPCELSVLLWE